MRLHQPFLFTLTNYGSVSGETGRLLGTVFVGRGDFFDDITFTLKYYVLRELSYSGTE